MGTSVFFWRSAVDQKVDGFGLNCIFFTQSLVWGQTEQPEDFCLLPLSLLFEVVSKFPLVGFNWAKTLHPSKQMWSLPCKPPAFRPVPKTGTHTNGSAYPSLFSHVATFDIIRLQALLASFANDLERFCRAPMAVPQLVYYLACASALPNLHAAVMLKLPEMPLCEPPRLANSAFAERVQVTFVVNQTKPATVIHSQNPLAEIHGEECT